jgi:hypothetical protein
MKSDIITNSRLGRFGRLGNQMFQIACVLSISRSKEAMPVFRDWFCEKTNEDKGKYFRGKINRSLGNLNHNLFYYEEPEFAYRPIPYSSPGVDLHGYFQSEKYFEMHKRLVREFFMPSQYVLNRINSKYGDLLKKRLCGVHIRRGDYVGHPVHGVCTEAYYEMASKEILKRVEIDKFVVFSDDIEWCKSFMPAVCEFIQGNEDGVDLHLLSMCDHQIISNSSFSWWASWLNKNKNKIVLAPDRWFASGDYDDKDIYCDFMIKIPC